MLTLMMVLATVSSLDSVNINWRRALCWTSVITLAVTVAIGCMPTSERDNETGEKVTKYGLMEYPDRFWAYIAIALICLAILFIILRE